jgi:hypothetical protein|tara:strand:- start:374 stop:1582 length:1209 start_codon:yes stop_codon:yes gene_type:complete
MGKIELDHTGSGSGITLSSDGTDLLLDGTAVGGGGGADLYAAETTGSTDPTATGTLSLAIGSSANGSGTNAVAIGNGATAGTYSVGIGWNAGNTGTNNVIIGRASAGTYNQGATVVGYNASSSGYSSNQTALGYNSKANSGAQATALTNSYASGTDSFAAAIASNSSSYGATGANSVAIGQFSKATGSMSFALGGYQAIASSTAAMAFGRFATASGTFSLALGNGGNATDTGAVSIGYQSDADGKYSMALGFNSKASEYGKKTFASGSFAADGDAQGGMFVLRADTTDATATKLTTNNSTAGSTNQIIAASDTCITFDGVITAMQNGAQSYASWKIEGLLVNDGGTTTLVNSSTTVIENAISWGMALSADNTNNALAITVTGEAAHNIRWVANIRTSEVTYA